MYKYELNVLCQPTWSIKVRHRPSSPNVCTQVRHSLNTYIVYIYNLISAVIFLHLIYQETVIKDNIIKHGATQHHTQPLKSMIIKCDCNTFLDTGLIANIRRLASFL